MSEEATDSIYSLLSVRLTSEGLITAAICCSVLILAVLIVYRRFFHPLAHLPGPFLASVSGWYSAYYAGRGLRHIDQLACHDRYGNVVRWGPNYVSFNTVTAVQTIYGESRKNNIRKADNYNFFDAPGQKSSTFNTLEKGPQSRKRRILSHAFSQQALNNADGIIIRNVEKWCTLLGSGPVDKNGWTNAKEMTQYCDWFAFDTAVDLAFGKTFDLIGSPEYRHLPPWIFSCFRTLSFVGHSPILPYWSLLKRFNIHRIINQRAWSRRDQFVTLIREAIAEREEADKRSEPRRDYFYWLTHAVDSETKEHYSIPEVEMECVLLWNAGTNGPSMGLAGAFFYLVTNPDTLEQLTSEVRKAFPSVDEICTGSQMTSCKYLQAVLDEAIRLCPANTGVLPRQAMQGGQVVDGVYIPADTYLGVSAYCIHHNPDYFPDPYRFKPERWIIDDKADNSAVSIARSRDAFFSFSAGGSGCIGRPLAYQEMAIALARVVYLFDIQRLPEDKVGTARSLCQGDWEEFDLDDVHAVLTKGPNVQFRAVKR